MFITLWRRPTYIENAPGPINYDSCHCYAEKAKENKQLIPEQLSFDRILNGKTLPPASLNDFMDYLLYVSRSAENLQFLLWLKDYTRRFNALSESEISLSPEWEPTRPDTKEVSSPQSQSQILLEHKLTSVHVSIESFDTEKTQPEDKVQAQPFRAEINRVIQHYLIAGAPRELNLCYRVKNDVLQALKTTTHPCAFKQCRDLVEQYLRHQSHPNFVRWAITNGRQPRTIMLRHLCVLTLTTFIASQILLTLSGESRWLRIIGSPLLLAGLMQLQCMFHGLCMVLFISGQREMRPWEMFANDEEIQSTKTLVSLQGIPLPKDALEATSRDSDESSVSAASTSPEPRFRSRINTFGPRNSFEHESWNEKWMKMPWIKKWSLTFSCTKIPQADPAVKRCQSRIICQSFLIGLLITTFITAGLVAIPETDLF